MTNKIIQHPLRTIELTYNEMTPFHPAEEAMLDRYTSLHSYVSELCEEYNNVQQQYISHEINIKRAVARFRAIKTRLAHLNKGAKSVLSKMVPDMAEVEAVLAEGAEFTALLAGFNTNVEQLAKQSNNMLNIFAPLDTKDEQLSEIFKEYRMYRGELAGNPANYSLDFEKYGSDEQAFLNSLNNMSNKQNEFIETCNNVIDRYNLFVEEVEKTLAQWVDCNKMLTMLKLVGQNPYDVSRICLN